jgi:hypothetical protein
MPTLDKIYSAPKFLNFADYRCSSQDGCPLREGVEAAISERGAAIKDPVRYVHAMRPSGCHHSAGEKFTDGTDKSFVFIYYRPLIQHQLHRVHAPWQAETFIVTNHF